MEKQITKDLQFDFGQNWVEFSKNSLSPEKVKQAITDFSELISGISMENKSFLDIGFGQGLGLLTATQLKAKTVGCDINPKCKSVLERNKFFFSAIKHIDIPVIIGSILDKTVVEDVKKTCGDSDGKYYVVHSWGVLHHTGKMWNAINTAANLVKEKGFLVIAIYNKHWTSFMWKFIKWFYNISPVFIRWMMVKVFYVIIACAKFMVTGKNPLKTRRGMSFYYDVVDWTGGYPYEYASKSEIVDYLKERGFRLMKFNKSRVPTGCNEFVFEKQ